MLESIGYTPQMARWAAQADAEVGRVLCVHRGVADVLTEGGPLRAGCGGDALAAMARDPEQAPCTGDWVVVRSWPDHRHTIEAVLPRASAVVRSTADARSQGQVLCANADLVGVVAALHPEPVRARVERLLTVAWQSGATPLVILSKADLAADAAYVAEDVAAAAPGVEVLTVSSTTGAGVARLRSRIGPRGTLALIGASGHGKSSLANALVGAPVLAAREIRADGRGRHTTVRRELVVLPGGGAVIDTPGLRGIGLVGGRAGLARAFADVEALVARCRFADCSHGPEPGCAVRAAIAGGALPLRRYESWRALDEEATASGRRRTERLQRRARPSRRTGSA